MWIVRSFGRVSPALLLSFHSLMTLTTWLLTVGLVVGLRRGPDESRRALGAMAAAVGARVLVMVSSVLVTATFCSAPM